MPSIEVHRKSTSNVTYLIEHEESSFEVITDQHGAAMEVLSPCCAATIETGLEFSCVSCGELVTETTPLRAQWYYGQFTYEEIREWLETLFITIHKQDPLTASIESSCIATLLAGLNDAILATPQSTRFRPRTEASKARIYAQSALASLLIPLPD